MSNNPANDLYVLWWKEAHDRAAMPLVRLERCDENLVAQAIVQFRAPVYEWVQPTRRDGAGRLVEDRAAQPRHWREEEGLYVLFDGEGESVAQYEVRVAAEGVHVWSHDEEGA